MLCFDSETDYRHPCPTLGTLKFRRMLMNQFNKLTNCDICNKYSALRKYGEYFICYDCNCKVSQKIGKSTQRVELVRKDVQR